MHKSAEALAVEGQCVHELCCARPVNVRLEHGRRMAEYGAVDNVKYLNAVNGFKHLHAREVHEFCVGLRLSATCARV